MLEKLLRSGFINQRTLEALPDESRQELAHFSNSRQLLNRLVDFELLTSYQAERIRIGKVQGLILDNYRVLDRLGAGSDGVIFRGEHRETGQKVAIKVLIPTSDFGGGLDSTAMLRFFAERKTVAQLCHPGIVRALDFGQTTSDDPDEPVLYFYVMEHVPGLDLEKHVLKNGPMQPSQACEVVYQVAGALSEAHEHDLVHRDIKPSNIVLTPEGRAMLLDFGLVRQFHSRQTVMGSLVGMLEWIAPEQRKDAHAVDIRADIYSLGCTLFWCLAGQSPHVAKVLPRLSQALPPSPLPAPPSALLRPEGGTPTVRALRGDISPELEAVVACMMAPAPESRYPDPQAVMAALAPFVSDSFPLATPHTHQLPLEEPPPSPEVPAAPLATRVLIICNDTQISQMCRETLEADGFVCDECRGEDAVETVARLSPQGMPDLVLLDADLPGMMGPKLLSELRQASQKTDRKIIMLIRGGPHYLDIVRPLLAAGADDYLIKPIDSARLLSRAKTALHRSDACRQDPPPSCAKGALETGENRVEVPAPKVDLGAFWQSPIRWLFGPKKPC